ncbi:MAG: cytochrome c assembly protein [Chitinophagaceae bacterium]|nr:cytochrome c assembly protein [Chitinophagaceae bacterium]
MKFEGEHLLPGQVGHFFVLLAFVASLVSTIAYFKASRTEAPSDKKSWLRYARGAFFTQVISVLTIFGIIFFICSNHYFEYLYAYKHASKELESKYLLACIWEGQEGSFLLWTIWHSILGIILILKSKKWEAPVMTVISFAQVFLALMLLGLYFSGVRIGSNPFVLTRNELEGPIFSQPNYLSFIKDGVGLNVLLRNYWMVIHPPVLFLGFASTLIPLAFAYAGIQTKKFGEWIKPALPWALASACVLGVGIMMGGKWAYESLSFGGYWAWDPVENASLVPWLILIAGLHCMAIYNATGNSLKASFVFIILTNAFVLYSTFLTRTGILGDTSVHSFTEAGMAMNILIGLFALAIPLPMFILFFKNAKKMPAVYKEENISSREFWMFIGSLIIFLSALFIISVTSVPVYNKIFNTNIADPQDREFTYNKVMILVAVIIGILTAASQYFKYRQTDKKYFLKKIAVPFGAALIITILLAVFYPIEYIKQGAGFLGAIYLAIFAAIFSAFANASYIWSVLKGNIKAGGAAIAHTGFALMIVGMLISSGNKKVISDNRKTGLFVPFAQDPDGKHTEDPLENLTLIKMVPTRMADYVVTYVGDSSAVKEKNRSFYKLVVEKKDLTGRVSENFELTPDVYKMKDNNLSSNPDIKHYLFHDVFTYISSLADRTSVVDTARFNMHEIKLGDSIFYSKGYLVLNDVLKNPDNERFHFKPTDTALVADITVYSKDSTSYKAYPLLSINNFEVNYKDDTVFAKNLYLKLAGITQDGKFKIAVKESDIPADFLTLKAYVFPYINLVWLGLIIMAAGFIVSLSRRIKLKPLYTGAVLIAVIAGLFYMFLLAN